MPEYLAPGVYVEEISTGPKPIEGVSTSTAGFLGMAERGPEYPRLITSWLEFQRWYGSYIPGSYLAYAVQGFFDNGGQRCFVGRIVGNNAQATTDDVGNLVFMAVGRGTWGNRIRIRVDPATQANPAAGRDWFRIRIVYYSVDPDPFVDPTDPNELTNPNRREPDALEDFDNLTHIVGASNNVETVINSGSHLVRVWWNQAGPDRVPDQALLPLGGNGADGDAIDAGTFEGDLDPIVSVPRDLLGRGRGLAALGAVDEVALVIVPDEVRDGIGPVRLDVIEQCELLKDRFFISSVNQGASDVNNALPLPQDSTYAAFYYPWIYVYDPVTRGPLLIPPSGHIAGIYARTDIERGVFKAPANEVVRSALDLEFPVTKGMQDFLNPRSVNCIRDFRTDGRGIRLWGARTMSSDPEWKYVNVRRLFIFVEESVDEGTQWVVFEPNDANTWARVVRSITNFLITVWRSGALMGTTQDEAFFVKCDRTTMTQDDIDNGRLICYIGIAPVKPAEFVIFRISQKTAEAPA